MEHESSVNKRPVAPTVLDVRDRFHRVSGARVDEVALVPLKDMEIQTVAHKVPTLRYAE